MKSLVLLALVVSACAARSTGMAPSGPADRFDAFARAYFDQRFAFAPLEATYAGIHTHDGQLDDLSPAGVDRFVAFLHHERDALAALVPTLPEQRADAHGLQSDRPRLDAQILLGAIDYDLHRLTDWNDLANRASLYHSTAADSVYQLVLRDFASVDERVRNGTARLRAVPALLAAGEHWLSHPPRLAVEVALREIGGSIEMVRDIFPHFADGATDPALRAAAHEASALATAALQHHRDFLQTTVLPRATGDYHDGRAQWTARAQLFEGVTDTPELIRNAALAEVYRLQGDMRPIAARLAHPGEQTSAVVERLRTEHPTPAGLLDAYRGQLASVRDYVRAHGLAVIDPHWDNLTVEETPAFLRSTTFAALSSPGPLEQVDRRAIFYVTPADMTRPASEVDAYLTEHSNAAIVVTTVHEAYPGHHVQGIHSRGAHSLVRQLLWQSSYGEGWAHYAEQMMVDEGLGNDEVRLDQRQEALLRAARAYLDPSIHVFGANYDDAVRFYRQEALMSQPGAEIEARRVSLNPATVFEYTYGKFGFYRLRHAVVGRNHGHPTLAEFHNAVLDFGSAPLPLLAHGLYAIDLPAWNPGDSP